ncbi:hypothetical protein M426DRAFT_217108 [Hypoxylon sp. CI-4A]|nr:hypothetical protein M426DRAFT_217108 [Hypoxylon sp. CI-4A]
MVPNWSRICALLYLVVCFNLVAAGRLGPYPRQDVSPTTTSTPTATETGDAESATATVTSDASESSSSLKESSTEVTTAPTSSDAAITPVASAINGNNPSNNSYTSDPTIAEGDLPLQPRLTPGWGVSGAIMLITGIVYTLIGIKNTRLHTFFSSAFLSSLCITVLIVYVMSPPVSDAIQGAYVVAAVCTGLLLGGAATIFKELTEGLGCLLGGFCLSMWLLTLHEGGLLTTTTGKVIFITVFTAVGFAFYFSRYTRPYALIGLMSFAGATVIVLGIDCFSRAGLKEFWVYIWNLNDNLFPLEATTYPLTKGIKVEIAVTVVLTIVGLISQLKLWRVIQEHRAKRAEEQAEFQRMRDEEEAVVGRRIEEDNERERRQWETHYGDYPPPMSPSGSRDSGVGEMENEKKARLSQTTVQPVSPSETDNENAIEMTDIPTSDESTSSEAGKQVDNGLFVAKRDEEKRVTIRVSRDDRPDGEKGANGEEDESPMTEPDEKVWMAGADDKAHPTSPKSLRKSQRLSNPTGPEIVPLPFRIPEPNEEEMDDGDRSSFATFADEDERYTTLDKRASRGSLSHRLSVGSGKLLRSLSQRSHKSKRQTGEFEPSQAAPKWRESYEDLVERQRSREDTGSIAATIDGLSDNDDEDMEFDKSEHPRKSMEIKAELADQLPRVDSGFEEGPQPNLDAPHADVRPYSTAETVATDILNASFFGDPAGDKLKRSSAMNAMGKTDGTSENNSPPNEEDARAPSDTSKAAKSASPSAVSSASLTKERLPPSLSRVALSYRTNEWAKHLSHAETPEPERLQLNEYPVHEENSKQQDEEAPAPVKVDELQQRPEDGIRPASIMRSPSSVSNAQSVAPVHRSTSRSSVADASNLAQATTSMQQPLHTSQSRRIKNRRQSGDVVVQPILEENADEQSVHAIITPEESDGSVPTPNPPSPIEPEAQVANRSSIPGLVSYSSPQTLMGKREMFIRNKSQSTLLMPASIPEGTQYAPRPASQMDLSYTYAAPAPLAPEDADDIPLSQRKQLMRQSSVLSAHSMNNMPRPNSTMRMVSSPGPSPPAASPMAADGAQFDSHLPQRRSSTLPSPAHREAQLASFRQSVAADLRAGTPISPAVNSGRETPFFSGSTTLLGVVSPPRNGNNDVQHSIDQQRNALLSQREQEMARREQERREKERNERTFEELMRRGDLMDAHREAMRRMQRNVKDQ